MDTSKVNRIEVIDADGRSYVLWQDGIKVELSLQDEGRTLKVFATGGRGTKVRSVGVQSPTKP